MQRNEAQQFKSKARQLVDIERSIYSLMQKAGDQIDLAIAGTAGLPGAGSVVIPSVVTLMIAAAIYVLRENGIAVIVLVLALLFMLGKMYSSWQNYSMRKNAFKECAAFGKQADGLKKEHARLIEELNALRKAAPERRYWWDAGLDPAITPKMPGQRLPDGEWRLGVFNELQLETKTDGIYLHDFIRTPVFYKAEWVEALRTGKTAELYRNDAVYGSDATAYACMHLYAYIMTPIEEIEGETTVRKVDRERVLEEYRDKVDNLERSANLLLNGDYLTNRTRYYAGRISVDDYYTHELYRSLAERDFKDRIPDEVRHSRYTKGFNNLWQMEFLRCATIFIAADGSHAGETALILMPNEKQDAVYLTVRTKSSTELCGYLESYVGMEPLIVGEYRIRPSLADFATTLFGSRYREYLGLHRRDVLSEKPRGLTDEEWVYLIRNAA